jgi:hypothetical protein
MTKSIPCLLAFAVSSSLVLAQAPAPAAPGGWSMKPGSGLKYDGGDPFGMTWTNRLQVHWTLAANEDFAGNPGDDTNTFNIRRLRTKIAGHIFNRNLLYNIELDGTDSGASGDGAIKEGWAQWNLCSCDDGGIGLRVGQGKTQFGLEATGSSGGLWFVERSSASRAFSDQYSRGAWFNGVLMDHKLRWTAGAMNTDVAGGVGSNIVDRGEETSNSDNELSYVFTANFDPLGDFFGGKQTTESFRQGDWRTDDHDLRGTVGAGVALGNSPFATATGPDVQSTSINVNTAWAVSNINLLGEYFMRTDDQKGATNKEKPTGWAVSLGYLMPKNGDSAVQWGLGVRVNQVETDDDGDGTVHFLTGVQGITTDIGTVREISFVVDAFYHGHNCKTQMEVTHQDVDIDGGSASDRTNYLFRIGFQLEI